MPYSAIRLAFQQYVKLKVQRALYELKHYILENSLHLYCTGYQNHFLLQYKYAQIKKRLQTADLTCPIKRVAHLFTVRRRYNK